MAYNSDCADFADAEYLCQLGKAGPHCRFRIRFNRASVEFHAFKIPYSAEGPGSDYRLPPGWLYYAQFALLDRLIAFRLTREEYQDACELDASFEFAGREKFAAMLDLGIQLANHGHYAELALAKANKLEAAQASR